jgi:hypothetical protein
MNSLSTEDEPRIGTCTSVEFTPNFVVDTHLLRPSHAHAPPELWTPACSKSQSMSIGSLPLCPDSALFQSGDCLHTPTPRIHVVPMLPPRPSFQLSMRPLIGRSNYAMFERVSWTLEVRAAPSPSRPSRRPMESSLFLPIHESPGLGPASFRAGDKPVVHQVPRQSVRGTNGAVAIETEHEQPTKFKIYPAPPKNVYFPQF